MGVKLSDRNINLKKQSIHPMTSSCRYFNSMKATKLIDFKIVTLWYKIHFSGVWRTRLTAN